MGSLQLKNEAINEKLKALRRAQADLKQVVKAAQIKCDHSDIAQAEHASGHVPVRICLSCGLTEDGWGCGYRVLRHPSDSGYEIGVPPISSDALCRLRQGFIVKNTHRTQLLRKLKTIEELINDGG